MITRVKGTQDFLDLRIYNFAINVIKNHLKNYNFKEIGTPILEKVELFNRSVGESSDIVNKEMFTLTTKGDDFLCLRPEATAPIVRSFLEANISTLPWKVFLIGPMFRYERPQKGRFRQFHQVSIESIGTESVWQDAQFIKMLDILFREKFLLDSYVLVINYIGCKKDRSEFNSSLVSFLNKNITAVCEQCKERSLKNPMRVFDCKSESCKSVLINAPKITDFLCSECKSDFYTLKEQLDLLSVPYVHSESLVRGLDYYNKTVFEFVSTNLGAQNAFCGGGRYDQLTTMLGGKEDQPSIGAGIGLERLVDIIDQNKGALKIPQPKFVTAVIPMTKDQNSLAQLIANDLIKKDFCIETIFNDDTSIKNALKKANKLSAKYCVILGSDEQVEKTATVKNMITGAEEKVKQTEIYKLLV